MEFAWEPGGTGAACMHAGVPNELATKVLSATDVVALGVAKAAAALRTGGMPRMPSPQLPKPNLGQQQVGSYLG